MCFAFHHHQAILQYSVELTAAAAAKLLSHVQLLATPWTAAYQAPLPMGSTRQEYWSGLPLPSPGTDWVSYNLTDRPGDSVRCYR